MKTCWIPAFAGMTDENKSKHDPCRARLNFTADPESLISVTLPVPIDTLIFDASACGFPKPRIPLLPTGLACLSPKAPAPWSPAENFRHFTRGRYALREAYRLTGIGPGTRLLAPAYHCRTMLDPALALGSAALLYPLRRDLSPDLAALDDLAERSPKPLKVLLATHFFGVPQQLDRLSAWCAEREIVLIEDCCHTMFSQIHRPPGLGLFGEFVVSSPYKFLPVPDGGLIHARHAHRLDEMQTRSPSWVAELYGLASAWSMAVEHRHSSAACDATLIHAQLATIVKNPALAARDFQEQAGWSADYRPDEEGRAPLRYSQALCRHADIAEIARRRRDNYHRWIEATTNLPHCRPLFPELPEGCIPYMFPLYIDEPEPQFQWLKRLGMPIWRWDSIVASDCPTANDYRFHLLHLPCHQSLEERQLRWMIAVIRKVGGGETAAVPTQQPFADNDRRWHTMPAPDK